MKTFLAVTLFCRILIFESGIGVGADDDVAADYDVVVDDVPTPVTGKCDEVQPMSGFDSQKYLEKPTHMYVTHSRLGGRLGVCRELYANKYPNGTISYNYEYNGNGKPEQGVYSYTANCTGTEDSKQNGQISFNCEKQNVLDEEFVKQDLLNHEDTEEGKAEVLKVIEKMKKDGYKYEFKLKVTVLSTDYEKYILVHQCTETLYRKFKYLADNYVVFNKEEGAGLPEEVKTKLKEYNLQEDKLETRKICKGNEVIKK